MTDGMIFSLASGVFTIAFFAGVGFNRPTWMRTYTTAGRYAYASVVHMGLYVLAYVSTYLVIGFVLRYGFGLSDKEERVVTAAWLALPVCLVLRSLPAVARRMRGWAQRFCDIPGLGYRVADELAAARLVIGEAERQEAQDLLLSRGINTQEDWLPPVRPVHEALETATVLFLRLRKLEETDRRYRAFLVEASNEWGDLRQQFDKMVMRIARTLGSIDRLGKIKYATVQGQEDDTLTRAANHEVDDLLRRIVGDTVSDLCDVIATFYGHACRMAARGVMATRITKWGRKAAFAALGFDYAEAIPRQSYVKLLTQTFVVLLGGCFIFFLLVPSPPLPPGPKDVSLVQKVFVIASIVVTAMAIAIIPKRHWGFANSGLLRRTPWKFIVGAGFAALLAGVLINLAAGALLLHGWPGALRRLANGAVYLPSTFITACVTAWLVQDHRWRGDKPESLKLFKDAMVFAGAWIVGTLIARTLLDSQALTEALNISKQPLLDITTVQAVIGALIFGGAIGSFLPSSVRHVALAPAPAVHVEDETSRLAREVDTAARGYLDSGVIPLTTLIQGAGAKPLVT